jgi:hypothetical protein
VLYGSCASARAEAWRGARWGRRPIKDQCTPANGPVAHSAFLGGQRDSSPGDHRLRKLQRVYVSTSKYNFKVGLAASQPIGRPIRIVLVGGASLLRHWHHKQNAMVRCKPIRRKCWADYHRTSCQRHFGVSILFLAVPTCSRQES